MGADDGFHQAQAEAQPLFMAAFVASIKPIENFGDICWRDADPAVAMEAATKQRIDITASIKDGTLRWNVPAGEWKVMIFTCVRDGGDGLVDYLEPKAVDAFIKLTYQAYHDAMPEHFGTTIDGAFYDEPAFYHVQGGRAWTDRFNERFSERFRTNPI